MEYLSQPNLLLESLICLGRKTTGKSWEETEQRILQRLADTDEAFGKVFDELNSLTGLLIQKTRYDEETKERKNDIRTEDENTEGENTDEDLFHNIEGLPCNIIGLCSPAFLLFYPVLGEFHGDVRELAERIGALPSERIAKNILDIILTPAEETPDEHPISARQYMNTILSMNLPDSSKLALFNLYGNYPDTARRTANRLAPLIQQLQQKMPAIMTLISHFADGMRMIPQEDFFGTLARLKATPSSMESIRFRFHPFLLGLDTVLVFRAPDADDTLDIYSGFLREELANTADSQPNLADRVFSSYRLLGDRTRYDLLCYLKDHPAYGQELSFRFGLARNTIHHHMSKLLEAGLVSTTVRGNRVYFSLNTDTVGEFLEDQQKLLRPRNGATPPPIPEYGRPYLPYI